MKSCGSVSGTVMHSDGGQPCAYRDARTRDRSIRTGFEPSAQESSTDRRETRRLLLGFGGRRVGALRTSGLEARHATQRSEERLVVHRVQRGDPRTQQLALLRRPGQLRGTHLQALEDRIFRFGNREAVPNQLGLWLGRGRGGGGGGRGRRGRRRLGRSLGRRPSGCRCR